MIDESKYRKTLGLYATGVTIITSCDREAADLGVSRTGNLYGFTANSFTSLSLDPPLILFSLSNRSVINAILSRSRKFAVNILNQDQRDLSIYFSKSKQDKFANINYEIGNNGSPIFADSLAVIECDLEVSYPGGDHIIYVGRVTHLQQNNDKAPLIYYKGAYDSLS
jgi:flavin reductase (DIM6/NTAB) family NADH-FMN oxidoreductase RutF